MSYRVTVVRTGKDFDFGPDADAEDQELAERYYHHTSRTLRPDREQIECREHDDSESPELVPRQCHGCDRGGRGHTDRRVHEILVALEKRGVGTSSELWTVRHFDKRESHTVQPGESEEHKRAKDEYCAAVEAGSGSAETEKSLPSGRTHVVCDVLAVGSAGQFDIEVQRYDMTIPGARGRTTKIRGAGVEPVWSLDRSTPYSDSGAVPYIRTNDLSEVLTATRPVRDEWLVVSGVRRVFAERCDPRYGRPCPTRGVGRFCGQDHPWTEPLPALRVYEATERLLAGDLVIVRLASHNTEVLMSAADRDLYAALGGAILTRGPAGAVPGDPAPCDLPPERISSVDLWQPRPGFGHDVLDAHDRADEHAIAAQHVAARAEQERAARECEQQAQIEQERADHRRREELSRRFAEKERRSMERVVAEPRAEATASTVAAHEHVAGKAGGTCAGCGFPWWPEITEPVPISSYLPPSTQEWSAEIERRRLRWAAEAAGDADVREATAREAQRRRKAEWPIERIRALMAETRRS